MRDLPQGEGAQGVRLGGNSYSQMRSPFPRGVRPSGSILSSCLIIPNFHTSRCPIRAQLLDPLSTNSLYQVCWAQIPVRRWAQPENRNSTIDAICGKSCLCDNECNSLLRHDQVPQGRLQWPVYYTIRGEQPGGLQLNEPLAPCAQPSPPPGLRPPQIQWPAPLGLD